MTLGPVIAVRTFELEGGGAVTLKIGQPQELEEHHWCCPWQLVGTGNEAIHAAHGIDAVQALQLTFQMIGADISKMERLRFHGSRDLGLPTPEETLLVSEHQRQRRKPSN